MINELFDPILLKKLPTSCEEIFKTLRISRNDLPRLRGGLIKIYDYFIKRRVRLNFEKGFVTVTLMMVYVHAQCIIVYFVYTEAERSTRYLYVQ